ncbi:MAG TPA: D-hexose-6-phosphate mutarotase [Oculatellaceae cyanobacterium]
MNQECLDSDCGQFSIGDILRFVKMPNSLTKAIITTVACRAELFLQGAHLTLWQPAANEPVLFLSDRSLYQPGKAIRGGVPIIFPWFGARTVAVSGESTDGPSHGFARTSMWSVTRTSYENEIISIELILTSNDLSRSFGFDDFEVRYLVNLGHELDLQLIVSNKSSTATLKFEDALHTYFRVGDAKEITLAGLEATDYLDKTEGFKRKHQSEALLHLDGETDRPYLNHERPVTINDQKLDRKILVEKEGSMTTVVWNPWLELTKKLADMAPDGWMHMVCIETANAGENLVVLLPGQSHTMRTKVSVETLS